MIKDLVIDEKGCFEFNDGKNAYIPYICRLIECGVGDVCAGSKMSKNGKYVIVGIDNLEKPIGVGNNARVMFTFSNTESIDVVISWLEDAKKLLVGEGMTDVNR